MSSGPQPTAIPTELDSKLLEEISVLQLRARQVATGALAGIHRSLRRGSSIEFSEHKVYSPGDDIRHIDWHAFAKTDRYHVKQFEDETNLRIEILVDHSGSMGFRSNSHPSKLDYARTLSSALAYIALSQGDATGLSTFDDSLTSQLPPRATSAHLNEILTQLAQIRSFGPTGLAKCLDAFTQGRRRRTVVMILTDLFDSPDAVLTAFKRMAAKGHDVAVLHLLDPTEVDFPYENPTTFESMEDARKLFVHPRTLRNTYVQAMKEFLTTTQQNLAAIDVDYVQISTADEPAHILGRFLQQRAARSR